MMVPRVVREVKPSYPQAALKVGKEAVVELECIVLPDGRPSEVHVTKSGGPDFDVEAVKALEKWQFVPGTRMGKPIPALVTIELTFSVRETKDPSPQEFAQKLTDTQIAHAIEVGAITKRSSTVWLTNPSHCNAFYVFANSSLTAIANASAQRALKSQPYTAADVDEDLKIPVLKVFVASCPPGSGSLAVNGRADPLFIQIAAKGEKTLSPKKKEPSAMPWRNANGVFVDGLIATFDLASLPQGDFDIVVVSDSGIQRRYTVTADLRRRLFGGD